MAAPSFLFDLDGTVWDSLLWYGKLFHLAVGVDSKQIVEALRGRQTIVALSRKYGISRPRLAEMAAKAARELTLYAGVAETLNKLAERRVAMAMVTNLPAWLARPLLRAKSLDQLFPTQEYTAGKPNPAGLLRALEEMGRRPGGDVYYVGDSDRDADAARSAGIGFVWAAYGYGSLPDHEATVSIKRFSDILRLLRE